MKKVAVLQSNYIPWKGYFDIINDVDLFVFYDDVQYTKNDWRNRNKVKSKNGSQWLTVPVTASNGSLICEIELQHSNWASKHFKTLSALYAKAPYFKEYIPFLEHVYLEQSWLKLSDLNQYLIKYISVNFLGINTQFRESREFNITGKKLDRLLDLLKNVETDSYVSGPAAKDYIELSRFEEAGIQLKYKDYTYPEYHQLHDPFDHFVTIFDLLFHAGPDSAYFIWGWRMDKNEAEF